MRNLVLMLVLANVVFFAWNRWVAEAPSDGATHFRESDLGPALQMAAEDGPVTIEDGPSETATAEVIGEAATEADPPAADASRPPVAAAVGRPCVSIGPFEESDAAEDALARVRGLGNQAVQRAAQGEVFLGHWVQIRNVASGAESNRQLAILQENGIEDAYPVPEDDGERTISLGLFSDLDRAERLELRADSLGLDAEIVRHTREATVFWVDTRLEPGQDVRALEQIFGEGGVVLGDVAECPRSL